MSEDTRKSLRRFKINTKVPILTGAFFWLLGRCRFAKSLQLPAISAKYFVITVFFSKMKIYKQRQTYKISP